MYTPVLKNLTYKFPVGEKAYKQGPQICPHQAGDQFNVNVNIFNLD